MRRKSTEHMEVIDVPKLYGYAVKYSVHSRSHHEKILPGAFRSVLESSHDVKALFNHNPSQLLGRRRSGTLLLNDDGKGLEYELNLLALFFACLRITTSPPTILHSRISCSH